MPLAARLQRLSNGRTYLNATAAGLSRQSEWLEMSLSSASCMGGIDRSRADIGHQAEGCYKDAPRKRTLANGRNGSTCDLHSDGQLACDAGQVVRRGWSTGLAEIGQHARNPHVGAGSGRGMPDLPLTMPVKQQTDADQ